MTTTSVPATASFDVHDPVSGSVLATIPITQPSEVAACADRARAAQEEWAARSFRVRAQVIARFHDLVIHSSDRILDTIQDESGKARRDALAEIVTVAGTARYYLAHGEKHLKSRRHRGAVPLATSARTMYHPHTLTAMITPWNYPFMLGIADALPALLAGTSVLTKPSETTPLSAILARELLIESGMPEDLLQLMQGPGADLGPALLDVADYVGFTGSTETGRRVAVGAAERLIPCSLELGGKNPMLVLPGARIDQAVSGLLSGAFFNTGQTCISVERAYVHEAIWDRFVAAVTERTRALSVGASRDWRHDIGSLVSTEHADKVRSHIDDAVSRGATVVCGGSDRSDLGESFVSPTVLTDTTDEMLLHDAETFGPVVRLERVASAEEALARANHSDVGLNGVIWAGRGDGAQNIARKLAVGSANINSTLLIYNSFDVPMGGMKRSGIGQRHGAAGIRRFTRQQSIVSGPAIGGGFDGLVGAMTSQRKADLLLGAVKLWRRIPGIR